MKSFCLRQNYRNIRALGFGVVLIVALCSLCVSTATAEFIEPGDISISTEKYSPVATNFAHGTYIYDVTWQGLPVATAKVQVDENNSAADSLLRVEASAKTAKLIDLFYKMRFRSESFFDSSSLRPKSFSSIQKENSKEKIHRVRFDDEGQIQSEYVRDGVQKNHRVFHSDNFTLDPISAAFVARSLPIEIGTKKDFDVYNGKHRYLISFEVTARENIKIDGKTYDAFKVVPSVEKLTDTKGENRLKSAFIWISADESREVLALDSSVLVGKVKARLVGFVPNPTRANTSLAEGKMVKINPPRPNL
jgi:hypothetical protein